MSFRSTTDEYTYYPAISLRSFQNAMPIHILYSFYRNTTVLNTKRQPGNKCRYKDENSTKQVGEPTKKYLIKMFCLKSFGHVKIRLLLTWFFSYYYAYYSYILHIRSTSVLYSLYDAFE